MLRRLYKVFLPLEWPTVNELNDEQAGSPEQRNIMQTGI